VLEPWQVEVRACIEHQVWGWAKTNIEVLQGAACGVSARRRVGSLLAARLRNRRWLSLVPAVASVTTPRPPSPPAPRPVLLPAAWCSPIHDHPCNGCWMRVLCGSVVETRYARDAATNKLKNTGECAAVEGDVIYIDDSIGEQGPRRGWG